MPAIAAPPFSNIPIQQVPAPLTVPSYAGVTVPQVSGLHAELVVSSANSAPMQGGPGGYMEGSGGNPPPMSHLPAGAVIHPYAQDPTTISIPHQVPTHPVNQVSVVVDPRLNPQGGMMAPNDSRRPPTDTRQRPPNDHWVHGTTNDLTTRSGGTGSGNNGNRPLPSSSNRSNTVPSSTETNDSVYHVMTSNPSRYGNQHRRPNPPPPSQPPLTSNMPGPSGMNNNNNHRLTINNVMQSSPGSLASISTGLNVHVESSDEDDSDVDSSPFHWSIGSNSSSNSPQHHIQYIDPPSDFVFSESGSPNSNTTRGSRDDISDRSPTSQQRAMGSALQTLADAAALLSSSPQSNSSDDGSDVVIVSSSRRNPQPPPAPASSSTRHQSSVIAQPSSQHSRNPPTQHDPPPPTVGYSSTAPVHPTIYQQNPTNGVLTIAPPPPPQQTHQPNIYHHASQLAAATGYHPAAAAAHAHLEELPVFLPVIHSSVDQLEAEAVVNPIVPPTDGTAAAVLYAPHDNNVVVTSRPLPMVDVPPLIRIAAQNQRPVVMPGEQWPAQQIPPGPPPPPVPPPANFIRPQPLVAAATAPVPPNGGGFWEDVMVRARPIMVDLMLSTHLSTLLCTYACHVLYLISIITLSFSPIIAILGHEVT